MTLHITSGRGKEGKCGESIRSPTVQVAMSCNQKSFMIVWRCYPVLFKVPSQWLRPKSQTNRVMTKVIMRWSRGMPSLLQFHFHPLWVQIFASASCSWIHSLRSSINIRYHISPILDVANLIKNIGFKYTLLTNSMAYGTRRFNAAFTRALQ